jgi:hypothetical protein
MSGGDENHEDLRRALATLAGQARPPQFHVDALIRRVRLRRARAVATIGGGVLAVVAFVIAVPALMSGTGQSLHHSGGSGRVSSGTATAPPPQPQVRDVLNGDGIGQSRFGETPGVVERQLDTLLGMPSRTYYPAIGGCGIDHAIEWPGLIVFFHRSQFVGYTYRPPRQQGQQRVLATARGLRVGDKLSYGQLLYGRAFHMDPQQGGVWWVTTSHGQIDGFASGPPQNGTDVGPRSVVATIEAGNVGCPAMTP